MKLIHISELFPSYQTLGVKKWLLLLYPVLSMIDLIFQRGKRFREIMQREILKNEK